MSDPEKIAYLYSRYPVVSQTFCDSEMLALENSGNFEIEIGSLNPPPNNFRHERLDQLEAEIHYPPPPPVLSALKKAAEANGTWRADFGATIARHDKDYGPSFKADIRARNALYFGDLFKKRGVRHIHVHFANRATHTALFIKKRVGIPFSFTAHAQDFMVDLGSDDLLRELCQEAAFILAVSDYSADLLRSTCPDAAEKIHRVYNGLVTGDFPAASPGQGEKLRILSIGRLIEFKGFHHLIGACSQLADREIPFELCIIGEGPWREQLEELARQKGIHESIEFAGVQSQEAVKERLASSDVFALASIIDSKGASDILPTVIMEAMASGLPIVSTELVGIPEMVVHDETGILCPPGDEDALAVAFTRLQRNQGLAERLGDAGRKRAEERFELQITSAQVAERIQASLSSSQGKKRRSSNQASTLYLVDQFPARDPLLAEELATARAFYAEKVDLFSMRSRPQIDWRKVGSLGDVEFLPDAVVMEAEWLHGDQDQRQQLVSLRPKVGTGVSTEDYYRDARRALYLAKLLQKRPAFKRLHAVRSSSAVVTWLIHRLTGLPFTLTLEPDPEIGPTAIKTIVSDASNDPFDDLLQLEPFDRRRRLVLGPLKMRLPGERRMPDRGQILRKWFDEF